MTIGWFSLFTALDLNKQNMARLTTKRYAYIAIAGLILQLVIFKQFYPFADYNRDSYNYILAAISNSNYSLWPTGYSKFLHLLHRITNSDFVLTTVQYLLLEVSGFLFFITLRQRYAPAGYITNTLFAFLLFNPLFLYISNYVAPDSIFIALSLLWISTLLRIIDKPAVWQLATQAVLLLVLMTIKIQALWYPLISVVVFLQAPHWPSYRIAGIATCVFVVVIMASRASDVQASRRQTPLAAVMGWNLANNALYLYPHIDSGKIHTSPETRSIDKIVRSHFYEAPRERITVSPLDGAYYMYAFESPLRQYWLHRLLAGKNQTEEQVWCELAPVLADYGKEIIRKNPSAYARYYILPNAVNYLFPKPFEWAVYNAGQQDINPVIKEWFQYKEAPQCVFPRVQGIVLFFFSALFLMVNASFLVVAGWVITKNKLRGQHQAIRSGFILCLLFFGATVLFSITLAPVDLTSVFFPLILYTCFVLIGAGAFATAEATTHEQVPG
jgi:hypothetical protein